MTISAVDFQEDFKSELNRPLWKMSLQGVAKQSRLHLLHLWFHVVVLTGYSITRFPLSSRLLRPQDSHMTPDTNLEHNTALGSADCLAVFPVHKKSESLDNHFAIVLCMAEWPPPRWTQDEGLVESFVKLLSRILGKLSRTGEQERKYRVLVLPLLGMAYVQLNSQSS